MATRPTPRPHEGFEDAASAVDADSQGQPDDLENMLRSVHAAIQKEDRSLAGYLRSRPTWMRRGMLIAALAVPVLPAAVLGLRGDWGTLRTGATSVFAVLIAAFAIACAWLSTRPLQRRGLTRGLDWALFVAAVGVMVGAALLNRHADGAPTHPSHHVACMGAGVVVALPAMLAGRLLHRGTLSAPLLTATAAALMANLGQILRCPVSEASHCLMGHVSVALWLALPVLLLRRLL